MWASAPTGDCSINTETDQAGKRDRFPAWFHNSSAALCMLSFSKQAVILPNGGAGRLKSRLCT